jgi:hypothetical protein
MQCNVEFRYQLSICAGTKEILDRVEAEACLNKI